MDRAYKIEFYVPEQNLEKVKLAMFEAGAGKIGNYDRCCWQCPGVGQFRPLEGSEPAFGAANQVESSAEFKVEMICAFECIEAAVKALLDSHPYETPAYQYWQVDGVAK